MNKIMFFITILSVVSCSIKKKPIFIKVDDVKVTTIKSDTIRLKANAFFKNPNDISGKIATDEIKVLINGVEIAQVSSEEFKVPARKEFSIPLNVAIPTRKVFKDNKNGFLGGLLNSFLNKSIKVQFKGDLRYKVLGFSHIYPVDKIENINIKF
ncbi:Late embryogenesis abundant protein LEA-2 subgroup domain-containing protein [Tenacibaculum aestuariivivum]